jgi:hypothetical protein
MDRRTRIKARLAAGVAILAAGTGCLMAGNYQSARTLPKGQSSFGLNVSVTDVTAKWIDTTQNPPQPGSVNFKWPDFVPEFAYHLGMTDNLEVGGRIAPAAFGVTGDVKWRFLHSGNLHLAIDPEIGYQDLIWQYGEGRLIGIATLDVADNFSLNAAVIGGVLHSSSGSKSLSSAFTGSDTIGQTGVQLGVELRGSTFEIRPAFEWDHYEVDLGDHTNQPSYLTSLNTFNVIIAMNWISGQELQKLNEIQQTQQVQNQKLDNIQNTLDRQNGQQPPPPPPPPPPQ